MAARGKARKKIPMRGKRAPMSARATSARATGKKTGGKIGPIEEAAPRTRRISKSTSRRPRKSDI